MVPKFKVSHIGNKQYIVSYSKLGIVWKPIKKWTTKIACISSNERGMVLVKMTYNDAIIFAKTFNKSWDNIRNWESKQLELKSKTKLNLVR